MLSNITIFFWPGCKKAIGTQHYVLKCFLCHLFHCSSTLIYLRIGRGRAERSSLALLWHKIIFCDLRRGLKEVLNQGPIKVSYLCVPSQFVTINLYLKVCVCVLFFFPFCFDSPADTEQRNRLKFPHHLHRHSRGRGTGAIAAPLLQDRAIPLVPVVQQGRLFTGEQSPHLYTSPTLMALPQGNGRMMEPVIFSMWFKSQQ